MLLFICLNRWLVGIPPERIVSTVFVVVDGTLRSSPMIALTSFDPTFFVSLIFEISAFAIANLKSVVFLVYFDFIFRRTDVFWSNSCWFFLQFLSACGTWLLLWFRCCGSPAFYFSDALNLVSSDAIIVLFLYRCFDDSPNCFIVHRYGGNVDLVADPLAFAAR